MSLAVIGIISLVMRVVYFEPSLPLTVDALKYFFYAYDTSFLGHLPLNYSLANNGWPIFVSFFFSLFHFEDVISYMQLQRILSIIISTSTILPVYLLCKRYFEPKYSLIGAAIIGFEPRLVQNSLLGISDSLYLLAVAVCFYLILRSEQKVTYLSFAIAALGTIVRAEGLFLFIALSMIFLVRNRKHSFVVPKYLVAVVIFAIVLLPMVFFKIEVMGDDAIFMRTSAGISNIVKAPEETGGYSGLPMILRGVENFPKYLGWDLIPIFIFFVPIGFFLLIRKRSSEWLAPIIGCVVMSVPAFYVYSIPLQDTRYLFYLYPLFCVISLFTVNRFVDRLKLQNLMLILIITGIIIASTVFLLYIMDIEREKDALATAITINRMAKGINEFPPESRYLQAVEVPTKTDDLKDLFLAKRESKTSVLDSVPRKITILPINSYESVQEFVEAGRNEGLTHLVVDLNDERPDFVREIFNENKYSFLIKEHDLTMEDRVYHVKIYRIDYDLFDKLKNEN